MSTLIKASPVQTSAGQLTSFVNQKETPIEMSFATVKNETVVRDHADHQYGEDAGMWGMTSVTHIIIVIHVV